MKIGLKAIKRQRIKYFFITYTKIMSHRLVDFELQNFISV
jgi:hypothetical protein